jgi:hypothetical protein
MKTNGKWNLKVTDFWGILFVLLFFSYVIPELSGVFTSEAENER